MSQKNLLIALATTAVMLAPLALAHPSLVRVPGTIRDGGFERDSLRFQIGYDDFTQTCVANSTADWCSRSVPGQPEMGTIDCTVAAHGACSLKILQRTWGAGVNQRVAASPGANVTLSFDYLNPRGGTGSNKWFTAWVFAVDAQGQFHSLTELNSFDPVTSWKNVTLGPVIAPPGTVSIQVTFGTGNGCGCYYGTDWATWVDDVALAVDSPSQVAQLAAHIADAIDCTPDVLANETSRDCAARELRAPPLG